jgi:uncharacterized protein YndB with AHSA1/START domain
MSAAFPIVVATSISQERTMEFEVSATIPAPAEKVWSVWTDLEKYPEWDPREERLNLDVPFGEGATGSSKQIGNPANTFTITDVVPGKTWTTRCALPGGELAMRHELIPDGDSTRVVKRYTVSGPFSLPFRLFFAGRVKKDLPGTFDALAARVATT